MSENNLLIPLSLLNWGTETQDVAVRVKRWTGNTGNRDRYLGSGSAQETGINTAWWASESNSDCTVQSPIWHQTLHREGSNSWCTRDMAVLSWRNCGEGHKIDPSEWDQRMMSKLDRFAWLTVVLKSWYTCSLEFYFPGCISTCSAQALKLKKIKICQHQHGQGEA